MKLNLSDALSGTLDEQLNLALCEWRGWKDIHFSECWGNVTIGTLEEPQTNSYKRLPNHITAPESLGLVHEVEKGLTHEQNMLWISYIDELVDFDGLAARRATARQRVIALLMTVKPELFQP